LSAFPSNHCATEFIVSIPQAATASFPREGALLIAGLLALTGGYTARDRVAALPADHRRSSGRHGRGGLI
jgi:hypothetical protein